MDENAAEQRKRVLRIIQEERELNRFNVLVEHLLTRILNRIIDECQDLSGEGVLTQIDRR